MQQFFPGASCELHAICSRMSTSRRTSPTYDSRRSNARSFSRLGASESRARYHHEARAAILIVLQLAQPRQPWSAREGTGNPTYRSTEPSPDRMGAVNTHTINLRWRPRAVADQGAIHKYFGRPRRASPRLRCTSCRTLTGVPNAITLRSPKATIAPWPIQASLESRYSIKTPTPSPPKITNTIIFWTFGNIRYIHLASPAIPMDRLLYAPSSTH